eukprot:358413-Chlamydomonas_euryale.AAC.18
MIAGCGERRPHGRALALRQERRSLPHAGRAFILLTALRPQIGRSSAPSPLLDPFCLAAFNTGIPFVGPLPVTLTLRHCHSVTLTFSHPTNER